MWTRTEGEIVWTMTEAVARTRSDANYALFSIAPSRRRAILWTRTEREIVWTRTEAAARTRSDADYALFSTAPSRRCGLGRNGKS